MDLLIGFDIGTTTIKGVLAEPNGGLVAQAARDTELIRPQEGRVEFSPERCYELVCQVVRELLGRAPSGSHVTAIALSGATGNTVLLDSKGAPLCNAINWMDSRAQEGWQERLKGVDADEVYHTVGWPFGGGFPLGHLAWLRENRPDEWSKAAHYCMNITYLYYRLSGLFACDHSSATTFYLQDQVQRSWNTPYLEQLGLTEQVLPHLRPSASIVGTVRAAAAEETGLDTQTRVVLGSFDHPSAARGVGVSQPGQLLLSCGTSWVGFFPMLDRDTALDSRLLVDPFLQPEGPWGALFSLAGVGVTLDTLIQELVFGKAEKDYALFNDSAARAEPGAGGLMLNPVDKSTIDPARLADTSARYDTKQCSRAIMEGAAYEMRRRIALLEEAGIAARDITMVGGPSESRVWTSIVAEVTGLPIRLTNGQVAGALGAAIMAGVGAGVFENTVEGQDQLCGDMEMVMPENDNVSRYAELYEEYVGAGG